MSQTYNFGNQILDFNFGNVSYTPASSYWLALSTTSINQDSTGITEPSGGGYSRVQIPNNKVSFTSSSNSTLSNAIEFTFPEATTDWNTITHFALFDAQTSGTMKVYGQLTSSRIVQSGTVLVLSASALQISIQNIT